MGANIQTAIDANPPGTIFQLSAGVYRMQSLYPKAGDQIVGALDASGKRLTTLTGGQPLSSFTRDTYGNYVAVTTQTQPGQTTGHCAWGYSRCYLPEDFFYDNEPYLHSGVGGAALQPGQYYFDYPGGKIYFRPRNTADDPNQHTVEYSRARVAVAGGASNVTVKNLVIEKYAIPAQFGAIGDQYPGPAWVIQNNEVRLNHGQGMHLASNSQALANYTHDNGQMGMGGSGNNILVQDNEIAHNVDYAGIDCAWECGGFKFAVTDGLIIRGNNAHDNVGPGMWTDIDNIRTLYEGNTVTNNTGPGIFHEISYDAIIRNNVIRNNGAYAPDDWFWNGQIQISTSQKVEIYGNIIELDSASNGNGVMLVQQNRSGDPCSYGPCRVANNYIHDNHITVTGARRHGSTGGVQDFTAYGNVFAAASNNRFDRNHYHVANLNGDGYWIWIDNQQYWPWLKPLNLEVNGTVDSNMSGDFVAPSAPSGLKATTFSKSEISITWNASTDNVGVAGYKVYRGVVQIGTTATTNFVDTGLTDATTYNYSVLAFDAAGNASSLSSLTSASTLAGDVSSPSVPAGLIATGISATQINVVWNPSTDNVAVTGYRVYRNGTQIAVTGATSYSDGGLAVGTAYIYSVAAFDAAGNVSARSQGVTASTKADTAAPTAPPDLRVSPIIGGQITLSWSSSTDNVGVAGYMVYRGTLLLGATKDTSFIKTGLVSWGVYNFSVAAYDAAGNVSPLTPIRTLATK